MFQTILVSPNADEYEIIMMDLKTQIDEGHGETIFNVGDATEGLFIFSFNFVAPIHYVQFVS